MAFHPGEKGVGDTGNCVGTNSNDTIGNAHITVDLNLFSLLGKLPWSVGKEVQVNLVYNTVDLINVGLNIGVVVYDRPNHVSNL